MRDKSLSENELMPLRRLAEISSYSPAYISLLVQRKKLKAKRVGRNFLTTKKWFNEYLEKHAQEEKRLSSHEVVSQSQISDQITAQAPVQELASILSEAPVQAPTEELTSPATAYKQVEILLPALAGLADKEKNLAEVFNKKIIVTAATVCFAVAVLFIVGLWQSKLMSGVINLEPLGRVAGITETATSSSPLPRLLALTDTAIASAAEADRTTTFASENFSAGQVSLGGEMIFLPDENFSTPLAVLEVKSESVTDLNGEVNKFFIAWRTNRLADFEILYFRAGEDESRARKIKSNDFSLSQSVVLSGLDKATVYNFIIKAHDRFGNEAVSNRFAAYSGSKPISIFELIINTLEDSFQWALRKE
ncbi:MAG: hypothetical protein WCV70_04095 [Patescibacteria group bacterium]|jgi:hypothetical protein